MKPLLTDPEDRIQQWMATHLSTCVFAQRWSGDCEVRSLDDVAEIPRALADPDEVPYVLVFPHIKAEVELYAFAAQVGSLPRWSYAETPTFVAGHDVINIELNYETPQGLVTCPLGLAPTLAMPATRRAPLVALGLWLHGQQNPHRESRDSNRVSLGDCRPNPAPPNHQGTKQAYTEARKAIRRAAAEVLDEPIDQLRPVTFRVSKLAVG